MSQHPILEALRNRLVSADGAPVYVVARDDLGRSQLLEDCLSVFEADCGARLWFGHDSEAKTADLLRGFFERLERYDTFYASLSSQERPAVLAVFERVTSLVLEDFTRLLPRHRRVFVIAGARKRGFLRGISTDRLLQLDEPYRTSFARQFTSAGSSILKDTPLSALPSLFSRTDTVDAFALPELTVRRAADKLSVEAVVSDDIHLLIADELPLFTARPYVITQRLTRAFRRQLATFESLINDTTAKEAAFQRYFEEHEHFLAGYDYVRVVPQVVLRREDGTSLRPDFMLQPCKSIFADLVELKLPTEEVIVGTRDRKRFAAGVFTALAQVREYRDYFEDGRGRTDILRRYGFTAYRPEVTVVIGRQPPDMHEQKLRQIADELPRYVRVLTYDDLLGRMRRMAEILSR